MSSIELRRQIESHTCRIAGERYTFKVRPAAERASAPSTPPCHTVLHVEAFRVDDEEYAVARMRITAPTPELQRIPSLLTKALEQWFLATAVPAGLVH